MESNTRVPATREGAPELWLCAVTLPSWPIRVILATAVYPAKPLPSVTVAPDAWVVVGGERGAAALEMTNGSEKALQKKKGTINCELLYIYMAVGLRLVYGITDLNSIRHVITFD